MNAVKAFTGDVLAYIGESRGGCTAWDSFFDELDKHWLEVDKVTIPNWHGRSDALFIYRRARDSARSTKIESACIPCASEKKQTLHPASDPSDLLPDFFRGNGLDVKGRTLAEMREFDFEQMESCTDFLQWMFPTDEASSFILGSPKLTKELQQMFSEDSLLRHELYLNLSHFCEFLGLELQDGPPVKVIKGDHFQQRVPTCWTMTFGSNHNWLRISRVLHCLGLCSLSEEQKALIECLEGIFKEGDVLCESAISHWRRRAKAVPAA